MADVERLGIELLVKSVMFCCFTVVNSEFGNARADDRNSLVIRANV
jgi:hypothetical protein